MDFDPNTYLQEKETGFSPDQYLSEKTATPVESIYSGFRRAGLSGVKDAFAGQLQDADRKHQDVEALKAQKDAEQPTVFDKLKDPDRWKAMIGMGPLAGGVIAGTPPLAIPSGAAPAALLAVSKAANATAPARIATNAALGAIQGAAHDPGEDGSRLINAGVGGAIGGGISSLGELISKLIPYAGSKLMNISKENAVNYAENPKLSEDLYNKFENDPEALNRELGGKIKDALYGEDSLFDKKAAPLLQKRGEMLVGKNIEIDPSQFKGTAAEQELNRIAAASGALKEYRGETSLPERLSLTGAQGQRVKKILQDAAEYKQSLNPIGYSSAHDAEALAASRLKSALEGAVPGIEDVNAEIGRNASMTEAARKLFSGNPARILNNSEAIGNTNVRALQNYLDENAGTNFGELANAFSAGKAVNNPSRLHGLMERLVSDPIGRMILKTSPYAPSVLQSPVLPQAAVGLNPLLQESPETSIDRRIARKKSEH